MDIGNIDGWMISAVFGFVLVGWGMLRAISFQARDACRQQEDIHQQLVAALDSLQRRQDAFGQDLSNNPANKHSQKSGADE